MSDSDLALVIRYLEDLSTKVAKIHDEVCELQKSTGILWSHDIPGIREGLANIKQEQVLLDKRIVVFEQVLRTRKEGINTVCWNTAAFLLQATLLCGLAVMAPNIWRVVTSPPGSLAPSQSVPSGDTDPPPP